jgi:hypothetical protein
MGFPISAHSAFPDKLTMPPPEGVSVPNEKSSHYLEDQPLYWSGTKTRSARTVGIAVVLSVVVMMLGCGMWMRVSSEMGQKD